MTQQVAKNDKTLELFLKKNQQQFTLNDAVAFTGMPVYEVKESLGRLMERYKCRLKLTEKGDLIYDFGKSLQRRGKKSVKEWLKEGADLLWKGFKAFYRVWITVTLVAYFVLFLVFIVGLVFVSFSRGEDDSDNMGGFLGGRFISGLFWGLFEWHTISRATTWDTDSRGYRYRRFKPESKRRKSNKKSFVSAVYDFVFGPARVRPEPLAQQKELAAYIRDNKGILVTSELTGLTGKVREQAEELYSDSLIRFNGDLKITDDALLFAEYPELVRSQNREFEMQAKWYWEEYEPPYRFSGNPVTTNIMVTGMNIFNLLISGMLLGSGAPLMQSFWSSLLLGWVPFTFSAIFFTVPTVRWLATFSKEKQRRKENIRKRVMRAIFNHSGQELTPEFVLKAVNRNAPEEQLVAATVEQTLEQLALDLQGEARVNEEGQFVYYFEKLHHEMQGIARIRQSTNNDTDLGQVQFETD